MISKEFTGKYDTYTGYELNLVLKDGRRINVMDHGDLPAMQDQAAAIAALIRKPIWDVITDAANERQI